MAKNLNTGNFFTPLEGYEYFEVTTQIILAEIIKRKLDFEIIDHKDNLIAVYSNNKEYIIREGTISDANSIIAYWISNDKWMTKLFLKRYGINHAKAVLMDNPLELDNLNSLKFPLVVKPFDTDHGIGVSSGINNEEGLKNAINKAFNHSNKIIVEEYFFGMEYRFLVVDNIVRAITYRDPANITGDGIKSIEELITEKNRVRGTDYTKPLLKIKIDEEVNRHLKNQGITTEHIPECGKKIYLRKNSNLSTGGDSIDVSDNIPEYYKQIAVNAAKSTGLLIAGIDIIISDLIITPSNKTYIVVELNAPPMLSMHAFPHIGKQRDIAKYVLDCILNSK